MPDQDPLADMISLFAAPVAGAVRSVEQFRTGIDEFLRGIENFNRTMENLNETAERLNGLLREVEEPIKAAVPQVTRAVRTADEVMQVVSGPAMAAAPGLARLAETMGTPAFQQLPDQLAQFSKVVTDMSTRMAPLTQLAESAGGLFGLRMPGRPPGAAAATPSTGGPAPTSAPARTSTARTSTAKTATAKKATTRKASPRKRAT
jgi:ABC-type transporter Mla subunit MlaD